MLMMTTLIRDITIANKAKTQVIVKRYALRVAPNFKQKEKLRSVALVQ